MSANKSDKTVGASPIDQFPVNLTAPCREVISQSENDSGMPTGGVKFQRDATVNRRLVKIVTKV